MPLILTTRNEAQSAFNGFPGRPGLVPTMGALHEGHAALIARSAAENAQTVVSIFVNPAQFGNSQDLNRYPRDLQADIARATAAGATHIFAPTAEEIYGAGFDSWVDVPGLADQWEGASRPGHFRGVCTVVSILLNLIQPRRSYFGEKDFQQLQVIRRMHRDLALPGEIIGCPTERDRDGLALSSRNNRLSAAGRLQAAAIPRALRAMRDAATDGERCSRKLVEVGSFVLRAADVTVDYLAIVDEQTLRPEQTTTEAGRILVAVKIDGVRLIDNAPVVNRSPQLGQESPLMNPGEPCLSA